MLVFGDVVACADQPGDGVGGDDLQIHTVGEFVDEGKELYTQNGDLFVDAFNFESLIKLKGLGLVKNLAVEPVLAGILIAFGCAPGLLFCHVLL